MNTQNKLDIQEIKKLNNKSVNLKKYSTQKGVRRKKEIIRGYEKIVFATDQDLD